MTTQVINDAYLSALVEKCFPEFNQMIKQQGINSELQS